MSSIVDTRGLSCPQPVIMTMKEIDKGGATGLVVLVDTDTAKENVSRAALSRGWAVAEIQRDDEGYRITIRKEG